MDDASGMSDLGVFGSLARVREVTVADAAELDRLLYGSEPFIVRGLVSDWPLVEAGRRSARRAATAGCSTRTTWR